MNKNLTEIVLVVDRSGSMSFIKSDAEGGVNEFIKKQKEAEGEANLTLVEFDNQYDFVHQGVNIKDVGEYKLQPRGMTALLDAVGRAINETKDRIKKMPKGDRPGIVYFAIVTDGIENASREYTLEQVRKLIDKRKTKGWHFDFLGADIDAFGAGSAMGIGAGNTLQYKGVHSRAAYQVTSDKLSVARGVSASGMQVTADMMAYTDADRMQVDQGEEDKKDES